MGTVLKLNRMEQAQGEARSLYSFSAGPSIMPREVLRKAQAEFLDWHGTGVSVLEMSHRSKEWDSIQAKAEEDLRKLLNIPKNYKVLFLQGGATLQFACIPLNLLHGKKTANYLVSGSWSVKAREEAQKYCTPNDVIPVVKGKKFLGVPDQSTWNLAPESAYFYYCDNETVDGVEFQYVPEVKDQILVCDMSSNFCSRPVDVTKYGLIYAGAQKNIGPAGVTVVIVREDLLVGEVPPFTPTMCNLKVQADNNSLYNTGPTYGIYLCGLYFEYLLEKGGLEFWAKQSEEKSKLLYDVIDGSNGFYSNNIDKAFRSRMNVVFRIKDNEDLENQFVAEAKKIGLVELKGHRMVGGCRASIYNGMPMEGVIKLRDFMLAFQQKHTTA
eukprot:TRINITY_DN7748_c0_g1_i1.p1 TRINITY_DN7748_c0_g1~~TRINITY_DN7748_c0_g1_i1.p1  ORF type:complete len:383 (-),score=112.95 TRINITY_DN7748_c0_g1_i1:87-1235(-)